MTAAPNQTSSTSPSARTRILRATLELIAEGSVDAVTHRAVAARAGVSPGSTTHHFATRDDLIREAFRHYLQIGETKIRALLDEHDRDNDPLRRIGSVLTAVIARDFTSGLVRAEYELLLHACTDPALASEVRAWEDRLVGSLAAALEQGGAVRPIRAARTLVNLTRGYELEAMLDPKLTSVDFQERLELVLTAIPTTQNDQLQQPAAPAEGALPTEDRQPQR